MDIGRITWKDEGGQLPTRPSSMTALISATCFLTIPVPAGALDTLETLLEFDEESGGSFTPDCPGHSR